MKISEYTLLQDAFEAAFPFMLNRMLDVGLIQGDPHADEEKRDMACGQAFNELCAAFDEMGIELGEVDAPLRMK